MEWTTLLFDGNLRALLHNMARAGLLPRGPLARVGYAKLGLAGALRECARRSRGLGRSARVGCGVRNQFSFFCKFVHIYSILL